MKKIVIIGVMSLACLISSNALAEVIQVPRNYATIQGAVDAAQSGDKIMVDGSYVGYGAEIIDKSLTLVGRGALITDGPVYSGFYRAGFIVRGAASSGTSISLFTFQDLKLAVYVLPHAYERGIAFVEDITISHNTVIGTAAVQAITLRGTKRGMVCYNRIDYASLYAIVGTGHQGYGNEEFTAKHNVLDFSQYSLNAFTGIVSSATRGAVITHNRIKMPTTYGQAVLVRFPEEDASQIISYNDFRGSAWDYWDSGMGAQWPGPYTPLLQVIYQRNFSDAGCFPTENRGIGVPRNPKGKNLPEII